MCVTYGETFLSDTKSYDSLYYEIIRATTDFIKLSEYGNTKTSYLNQHIFTFDSIYSESIHHSKVKR